MQSNEMKFARYDVPKLKLNLFGMAAMNSVETVFGVRNTKEA
jgi:hypothetical protein